MVVLLSRWAAAAADSDSAVQIMRRGLRRAQRNNNTVTVIVVIKTASSTSSLWPRPASRRAMPAKRWSRCCFSPLLHALKLAKKSRLYELQTCHRASLR